MNGTVLVTGATGTLGRAAGKRRVLLPLRIPGAGGRALRGGGLLSPERAVGRGTFEEALERRFGHR
ncbi:hypothetical protein ACFZDG_34445 [Kitasatospora xanthocidica]|uniref:hypothetical protein n=1 Tax=Kitasatospora xanthocidica TaxID=83382 RepID=UPI0036E11894